MALPTKDGASTVELTAQEPQLSLLLIDDDVALCRLMSLYLHRSGFRVVCSADGQDGAARAIAEPHDLVLLDVTLPVLDGFAALHQIRRSSTVPVIMLTSRNLTSDRRTGLDNGADDYLCKPFDPDELVSRIRAVLRRSQTPTSAEWESLGPLRLSATRREAFSGSVRVDLTAVEFELLLMLARSAGRVVKRDALTSAILERRPSPFDRSLDVHISHLRTKLGTAGACVQTVRGIGYVLLADPK